MQKSRNYIFLIELVPGGKGEGVDTAEITVRRILDELFDRAYRFRLRRLSQNSEKVFGFGGKFHVTIRSITRGSYRVPRKTESKRQMRQTLRLRGSCGGMRGELQPTRLPLQKMSIQRVEESPGQPVDLSRRKERAFS